MNNIGPAPAVQPELSNLLIAGLYSPGSGLTNVISVLMRELSENFSVSALGFKPDRIQGQTETEVSGCPVFVQASPAPIFLADTTWLEKYMQSSRPAAVIVFGPAYLTTPFLRQLQKYRAASRVVLYLSVEGEIINPEIARTLALADVCVLYTEFARRNLAALCSRIQQNDGSFSAPNFYVAGHGVDTSVFFPLPITRKEIRQKLFPEQPELHGSFVVLNANRAYYRKRLDLTIKGFAEFAAARPDAYLYLHTGGAAAGQLAELKAVIASSGAADRILLNALNPDASSLSAKKLNLLYNACDVGLTTAMGEGWGLTVFEHAAAGAPQIVPNHTSFTENWTGAAEMLPANAREHIFYEFADMFPVSSSDVAASLTRLSDDKALYRKMARAAYARALEPRFRWAAVGNKFDELLSDVCLCAGRKKEMTGVPM